MRHIDCSYSVTAEVHPSISLELLWWNDVWGDIELVEVEGSSDDIHAENWKTCIRPSTLGFADIGLESTEWLASLTLENHNLRASVPIPQNISNTYKPYIAVTIESTYHLISCNTAAWHQSLAHSAGLTGSTMNLVWPRSRPLAAMPTSSSRQELWGWSHLVERKSC